MKKMMVTIGAVCALSLIMAAAGCETKRQEITSEDKFSEMTTTESIYGFSAASAGILIDEMHAGTDPASALSDLTTTQEGASSGEGAASGEESRDWSELDSTMQLVESLLADGGFQVSVTDSDEAEYSYKMSVSYRDMDGNSHSYVMYYDQTPMTDRWDDDDDDHYDDDEEEYAIEGILRVDGADYRVRGQRSVERERDGSESETEFIVTLAENTFLYVEQSVEEERNEREEEYSYTLRENGTVTERSSFSYEEEDGETELKMVRVRGGERNVFYFERKRIRGQEVIFLRVGDSQSMNGYIVREGADGYEYEPVDLRLIDD